MKKAFVLVISALLLAASGCAAGAETVPKTEGEPGTIIDCEQLWNVDLMQRGYTRTNAMHAFSWEYKASVISLMVSPEEFGSKKIWENAEFIKENGREYTVSEAESKDNGGFQYFRSMRWTNGGYAYLLTAFSDNGIDSFKLVQPETAPLIEKGDFSAFSGSVYATETWKTEYRNNNSMVTLFLYPPEASKEALKTIFLNKSNKVSSKGGFECYINKFASTPGWPCRASALWNTDAGLIYLIGDATPEAPENTWDFINPDFARRISEQLGAKILPLPE